MINWIKYGLIAALAGTCFLPCQAQEDARLWLKAGIKKKVTRRLDLELENCLRLGENYTRLNSYYIQLSAEQELLKGIKFGLALRQSYRRKTTPEYHSRQRFSTWLEAKKKIFPQWELQYRLMFMRQYTDFYTSERGYVHTDFLRNKFGLQYKPNQKYSPFISCELYYRMRFDYSDFNRVRYTLGVDYRFDKHNKFTVFYRIQKRLNENVPMTAYILAFDYAFIF